MKNRLRGSEGMENDDWDEIIEGNDDWRSERSRNVINGRGDR